MGSFETVETNGGQIQEENEQMEGQNPVHRRSVHYNSQYIGRNGDLPVRLQKS